MDCSKEEEKAYNLLLENYYPSPDIASFAPRFKAGYIVTALYLAMVDKNKTAIRRLLSSGIDITFKRSPNSNIDKPVLPVDIEEQISLLLSPSCAYTYRDKIYKLSALVFAVSVGNIPMARLLIEKGFDINETARVMSFIPQALTALHLVVRTGDYQMVQFLLTPFNKNRIINLEIVNTGFWTALEYAVIELGSESIAELLLDNGATINHPYKSIINSLAMRVYSTGESLAADRNLSMIKFLLSRGALIAKSTLYNAVAKNTSVLHSGRNPVAIPPGDTRVIKLLLENGADINNPGPYGDSPLHKAVKDNDIDMVKFLLNNGANVDITGDCGKTPLYYAHKHNFSTILDELLLRGANKYIKLDDYGGNWMDVTIKHSEAPIKEAKTVRFREIPKIAKAVRGTKK